MLAQYHNCRAHRKIIPCKNHRPNTVLSLRQSSSIGDLGLHPNQHQALLSEKHLLLASLMTLSKLFTMQLYSGTVTCRRQVANICLNIG
ncbi:hypothetical protein ACHAWU_006251 [Discostella pseudostelligera]|uniref:Uncharacterized protein n=1 Tax=Discostella pseudostelligera TaxID=259834 RepID=A0ABD3MLW4_9STRA